MSIYHICLCFNILHQVKKILALLIAIAVRNGNFIELEIKSNNPKQTDGHNPSLVIITSRIFSFTLSFFFLRALLSSLNLMTNEKMLTRD